MGGVKLNNYLRGEQYGLDIIQDLNHNSTGWVDWNMIIDPQGGPCHSVLRVDAPIVADYVNQTLHYQVMYYYLGHYTKFIPKGSVRIQVDANLGKNVHATAFKRPDGAISLVVLNNSEISVEFKIKDVAISDAAVSSVPPHGIKTFIWKK
jgi:glucosylceramidase